jgi:hypothetical protein
MKKLVIITCLVAILIGGLIGGTATVVAKPTRPPLGERVFMEAGYGFVLVEPNSNNSSGYIEFPSVPLEGVVHVSLSLELFYIDIGNGSPPDNPNNSVAVLASGGIPFRKTNWAWDDQSLLTVDFNTFSTYSFIVGAAQESTNMQMGVKYYYTVTYPKP